MSKVLLLLLVGAVANMRCTTMPEHHATKENAEGEGDNTKVKKMIAPGYYSRECNVHKPCPILPNTATCFFVLIAWRRMLLAHKTDNVVQERNALMEGARKPHQKDKQVHSVIVRRIVKEQISFAFVSPLSTQWLVFASQLLTNIKPADLTISSVQCTLVVLFSQSVDHANKDSSASKWEYLVCMRFVFPLKRKS